MHGLFPPGSGHTRATCSLRRGATSECPRDRQQRNWIWYVGCRWTQRGLPPFRSTRETRTTSAAVGARLCSIGTRMASCYRSGRKRGAPMALADDKVRHYARDPDPSDPRAPPRPLSSRVLQFLPAGLQDLHLAARWLSARCFRSAIWVGNTSLLGRLAQCVH